MILGKMSYSCFGFSLKPKFTLSWERGKLGGVLVHFNVYEIAEECFLGTLTNLN